jgi:hypothetical protein
MLATLVELSVMMHQHQTAWRLADQIVKTPDVASLLREVDLRLARHVHAVLPAVIAIERADAVGEAVPADRRTAANDSLRTLFRTFWSGYDEFQADLAAERGAP